MNPVPMTAAPMSANLLIQLLTTAAAATGQNV